MVARFFPSRCAGFGATTRSKSAFTVTTFYLIRHGTNDVLPRALAGRLPGTHLNEAGRAEAERVAERLKSKPIQHIFSSPMERARETAEPLARVLNLPVQISEAFNEVDFGQWQGGEVTALRNNEQWQRWIKFRSGLQIPGGEMMVDIQARVVSELVRLTQKFPGEHIAVFSHGDPIRSALCHWLGMPLDYMTRLEVLTGSINIVALDENQPLVQGINLL
jgi:broad specificity phosphatase PhoE